MTTVKSVEIASSYIIRKLLDVHLGTKDAEVPTHNI